MSKLKELENRYARLFKDGKLVQVHVSKWGMACSLEEEDLNLGEGVKLPEFMRLGHKMLIDAAELKKFTSLEGKARKYLKDNSHDFPIAQAHFVPKKRLVAVLEKLNEFRDEYLETVDAFMASYGTLKEAMLTKYPEYREKLEPFYPNPEAVRSKFGFDLTIFEIAIPKKLQETDLVGLKAEEQAVKELQKKYEAEMEAQYQKGVNIIDKFLGDTVLGVRAQIVEVFETISKKIKNREVITKTNVTSLKNIIENFENLDFLDDEVINERIASVKALVQTPTDFKEDFKAVQRLGAAINEVLETAKEISDVNEATGRYFRKINIES